MDIDAEPRYLLTFNNTKILKGTKEGVLTAILHLAPHKVAGFNVCAHATGGCSASCLYTSGHGRWDNVQLARIQRTRLFRRDRELFFHRLHAEIDRLTKKAALYGLTPALRLNGTSDLPWERFAFNGFDNVFQAYPDLQFYDYTKYPVHLRDLTIPNYDLTYSLAESNRKQAIEAIRAGIRVAAVFRTKRNDPLPATYSLAGWRKVIDGDKTDIRFNDPAACIVGLRAKGDAIRDTSGFVLDARKAAMV